jgi:hypothetical protein
MRRADCGFERRPAQCAIPTDKKSASAIAWSYGTEAKDVVCSIDTQEYSHDYPREHWAYLDRGVLILSEKLGLVHCVETEGEMRLLARGMILAEIIPPKTPVWGVW